MQLSTHTIRNVEFPNLDKYNHIYLDNTGSALAPESLLNTHFKYLSSAVLGNPHSTNPTSNISTVLLERTRSQVLSFFHCCPETHTVIFTANASAAIKLVAESFPFRCNSSLVLMADNHNSVNGTREYAHRAGSRVEYIPLTNELRAVPDTPARLWKARSRCKGPSLFAYPVQSNFSGVKHPDSLTATARRTGYFVLADAAAAAPSSPVNIRQLGADFVCVSFYKMMGFPTGVGALIARKNALKVLKRPWFAGGTIKYAAVFDKVHDFQDGAAAFEDGTVNFQMIPAVGNGLQFLRSIGMAEIERHVMKLTLRLLRGLTQLQHLNGRRAVLVYGPERMERRGGVVAFNLVRHDGKLIDARLVEAAANRRDISIRTGCFCNPGASEYAFRFSSRNFPSAKALRKLSEKCQKDELKDSVAQLAGIKFLGSVRASLGIANVEVDVDRFLKFIRDFINLEEDMEMLQ